METATPPPTQPAPSHLSLKDRILEFAFQQGVSTVLLLLVLAAMWQGVPMLIDRVEARLEYINDSHEKRLSMVIEQHTQDRAMFQVEQKRLQEINTALLNKIHGPLDARP